MTTAVNSQIMRTITLLIIIFSLSLPAYAQYSGGTGDPNDPYQIATSEDLMLLGDSPEDYNKHFILTADIDLDPNLPGRKVFDKAVIAPDVNSIEPDFHGTSFTGVFKGNGHTISHLTIVGADYLGLFGQLGSGASISNLGMEAVDVNGIRCVGALVGRIDSWGDCGKVLTKCYSTGIVTGQGYVGGLDGDNSFGSIATSYSTCKVRGERAVGGLVGSNSGSDVAVGGILINCYSTGTVDGEGLVGGLAGRNAGIISMSHSTGTVNGTGARVGGLVGINYGSISTSCSTGAVSGNEEVGGLVGYHTYGNIATSYSTGAVSGNEEVGGLVGYHYYGNIATSYSTGMVIGNEHVGGLVGLNGVGNSSASFWDIETSGQVTSAQGTGLTTAEMQDNETYLNTGWDFFGETLNGTCDYWQISPGEYPMLRYHDGESPVMPQGLGTAEEPYLILDAQDLGTVWLQPWSHYRVEASVDLSETTWSMSVVPWFGGTFDGNNHVISNLHIQGGWYVGLFGRLGSQAKISNLGLEVLDVNGAGLYVGGLAGENYGSITNGYSTGTITGEGGNVGGLVGYNYRGSITMSHSSVIITGSGIVGGLVGENFLASIIMSYSTGIVTGNYGIGGLVGSNLHGSITKCYSACTARGTQNVGGLVGGNDRDGNITTCYSTGVVSGDSSVGGLVGSNLSRIIMCYSNGPVTGNENVGGLAGRNDEGSITSSFWDTETSRQSSSDGGTGKTMAEMQTASTFLNAGWDFVDETANGTDNIWWILEGQDYPRLSWEAHD